MLVSAGQGVGAQLLQQQRVLEDALDGFDHVGLQRGRVLLLGVPGQQELAQGLVGVCSRVDNTIIPCDTIHSTIPHPVQYTREGQQWDKVKARLLKAKKKKKITFEMLLYTQFFKHRFLKKSDS